MTTIFVTTPANFGLPAATSLIMNRAAQHGFDNIQGMTIGLPVYPKVLKDIDRVSANQAMQMGLFYALAHWATQLGAKVIALAPDSGDEARETVQGSSPTHDAPVHEYIREQVEGPMDVIPKPAQNEVTRAAELPSSPIEQERPFYEEALNQLQDKLVEMAQKPPSTDAVIRTTIKAMNERGALNMLILEEDLLQEVRRRLPSDVDMKPVI